MSLGGQQHPNLHSNNTEYTNYTSRPAQVTVGECVSPTPPQTSFQYPNNNLQQHQRLIYKEYLANNHNTSSSTITQHYKTSQVEQRNSIVIAPRETLCHPTQRRSTPIAVPSNNPRHHHLVQQISPATYDACHHGLHAPSYTLPPVQLPPSPAASQGHASPHHLTLDSDNEDLTDVHSRYTEVTIWINILL